MSLRQLQNFHIASGDKLNLDMGWLVRGVRVDNVSASWYILNPQGYVIPPMTVGWTTELPQASTRLSLEPTVFGGQPNFILAGDHLDVTAFDVPIGTSGGYPAITNDLRSAAFSAVPGATITTGALSFPAIGCRIDNNTGTWYQIGTSGVYIPPFTLGFTIDLLPPVVSVTIAPVTAPFGPPNNLDGSAISVTLYAGAIGYYGGTTKLVSSIGSGATFPSQPAYGSHVPFYRTDLDRFYFYDGTRWLSEQMFTVFGNGTSLEPISAASSYFFGMGLLAAGMDIWIDSWDIACFNSGLINNTNYWLLTLGGDGGHTFAVQDSWTVSPVSATWRSVHQPIAQLLSADSSKQELTLSITKVNAPGTLFITNQLNVRLVQA